MSDKELQRLIVRGGEIYKRTSEHGIISVFSTGKLNTHGQKVANYVSKLQAENAEKDKRIAELERTIVDNEFYNAADKVENQTQ